MSREQNAQAKRQLSVDAASQIIELVFEQSVDVLYHQTRRHATMEGPGFGIGVGS